VVENFSKDRFLLENDGEKSFENKNIFFLGPYCFAHWGKGWDAS
jgi:hypothetical protein